jgi:phage recombination protein Bet
MSNEVTTTQNSTAIANVEDYKAIATEWLTSTGNLQKFTENEKAQFIDMCTAFGLNPIKREIYGIKYGQNFNLIVGYETYIKRAERSGKLAGWKAWVEGSGNNLVAKIEIHRKDWQFPFCHEVYFEEYNQGTAIWKSKPRTMLRKVVIAQGFRLAFSEDLGGMPYTSDELPADKLGNYEVAENTKPLEIKQPTEEEKAERQKKITEEFQSIFKATYGDGTPVFSSAEIQQYRNEYKTKGGQAALEDARVELDVRLQAYEAADQE